MQDLGLGSLQRPARQSRGVDPFFLKGLIIFLFHHPSSSSFSSPTFNYFQSVGIKRRPAKVALAPTRRTAPLQPESRPEDGGGETNKEEGARRRKRKGRVI